jgi:acyl-CoA synthetase (AMP-forming)/AMP-acid ligase II
MTLAATGGPAPQHPPTFWALIERRAAATPDAVAFEDDAGRSVTFAGYRNAAEEVAAGFHDLGVRPGSVVSWQLPTAIDTEVVLGALTRLGAVQNPVIPNFRDREVRHIAKEAGTEFFVVRPEWNNFAYAAMGADIATETGMQVLTIDALPHGDPASLPEPPGPAPQRRWLYYTSGSTSAPKGAWHTDPSVMAGMNAFVSGVRPTEGDVYPIAFPIAHIGGVCMLGAALVTGFRTLLIEKFDMARSPLVMGERGATMLGSALPFFNAYLNAQREHPGTPLYPRLRICINGGAPKPSGLHETIKRELGGLGLLGSWGLTEFPIATGGSVDDPDDLKAATEGPPAPGVDIRVVGLDGSELGPGEEGELRVNGPQMFDGYADPALDPGARDEEGFFRTGDLGVVAPTGHVTITGRVKDVIIRNAENVSAGEVEDLLHLHPAVADVAVIGVPDPRTGERVCAIVKPAADGPLQLEAIVSFCREQGLAAYKIPERLEVIDEIPRNAMGKIDKPTLRKRFVG